MVDPQGTAENSFVKLGWNHLQLQRPLAAWGAWQRALRIDPDDKAARDALERFESLEELPAAARAVYRFRTPGDPSRQARWRDRLQGENLDQLAEASNAFRSLAEDDPSDADARLNLALCLAWIGSNREAIGELDQVVGLLTQSSTPSEIEIRQAVDAWTLAEVLRFGAGAETLCDDLRCVWTLQAPGLPADSLFDEWPHLVEIEVPIDPVSGSKAIKNGTVYDWLDRDESASSNAASQSTTIRARDLPRKLAGVIRTAGWLKLTSPDPSTFSALEDPLLVGVETALRPARREITPLPLAWADAPLSTFRLPTSIEPDLRDRLTRDVVEYYYENSWIGLARHGLSQKTPVEAAREARRGDLGLKAKLLGIIRFREQLGLRATHRRLYQGYPFDRLRRRLGLIDADANPASVDSLDISCMSEVELDALDAQALDDHALREAVESSSPFLVDQRTSRFANALIGRRSPLIGTIDPKALVAPIIRLDMCDSAPDRAIGRLGEVESFYDGRFRRTIRIWKAEVLVKSGRLEGAFEAYRELIADDPSIAALLARDGAETLRDQGRFDLAADLLRKLL